MTAQIEPIKTRLARLASRFTADMEPRALELERIASNAGAFAREHDALFYVMVEFIALGRQEWNDAKAMKTIKGRQLCAHRARVWFDAAELIKRRIENHVYD